MPSAFSHAIVAYATGKIISTKDPAWKLLVLGMVCSAFPDIDAVGFWAGIPYHSPLGHRGITHSFFFAVVLAVAVMQVFYQGEKAGSKSYMTKCFYLFLATASHPVLDAMTNGGLGVAFFAPFDNTRYFFPFRPIHVSPISITRFFSGRGLEVFKSELIWIWIPSALMISLACLTKRMKINR